MRPYSTHRGGGEPVKKMVSEDGEDGVRKEERGGGEGKGGRQ